MKIKIDSYLGFAKKSGNLVTGAGTCSIMAAKGKLKLMIIAIDIADSSREKMERLAKSANIPYRIYGESDYLSKVTGNSGRSVFGITEKKFAEIIVNEIDSETSTEEEVF